MPCVVSWPARIKPGKLDSAAQITDWMPTFCSLAGYKSEQDLKWDGRDMAAALIDGKAVADSTRIIEKLEALRPDPPLYPADPADRERALELGDATSAAIAALYLGELNLKPLTAALTAGLLKPLVGEGAVNMVSAPGHARERGILRRRNVGRPAMKLGIIGGAVAVVLIAVAAVLPARLTTERHTTSVLSYLSVLFAVALAVTDEAATAVVLAGYGVALGLSALPPARRAAAARLVVGAAACELVAFWLLLAAVDVGVVEAYTVPLAPHCTMSELGLTASLHASATVPHFLIHEGYLDGHIMPPRGEPLPPDDRRRMYGLGNRLWHTDASFNQVRGRYSMLHARVVPEVGGDHVVPVAAQRLQDDLVQRVVVALGQRMAMDDLDQHAARTHRARRPFPVSQFLRRSTISTKVSSPWPMTTTSTDGSARHCSGKSEGCQPPHTMGRPGRAALTARETCSASRMGAPVSTPMPRHTAPSRCANTVATGSASRRPSTITTSKRAGSSAEPTAMRPSGMV